MSYASDVLTQATDKFGTPAGEYRVKLKAMEQVQNDNAKYPGERVKWVFLIEEVLYADDREEAENRVGEEHWAYSSKAGGKRANMRKWAEALLGRDLEDGEPITVSALVGRRAIASIIPYTREDGSDGTKLGALKPHKRPGTKSEPEAAVAPARKAPPSFPPDDDDDF